MVTRSCLAVHACRLAPVREQQTTAESWCAGVDNGLSASVHACSCHDRVRRMACRRRLRMAHLGGTVHARDVYLRLRLGRAMKECRHLLIMRRKVLASRAPAGIELHQHAAPCWQALQRCLESGHLQVYRLYSGLLQFTSCCCCCCCCCRAAAQQQQGGQTAPPLPHVCVTRNLPIPIAVQIAAATLLMLSRSTCSWLSQTRQCLLCRPGL